MTPFSFLQLWNGIGDTIIVLLQLWSEINDIILLFYYNYYDALFVCPDHGFVDWTAHFYFFGWGM